MGPGMSGTRHDLGSLKIFLVMSMIFYNFFE